MACLWSLLVVTWLVPYKTAAISTNILWTPIQLCSSLHCCSKPHAHLVFWCTLGYLTVTMIHPTLKWTTGSLTCVCDLFACVYTQGTSVYSLLQRTWVASVPRFEPAVSQSKMQCPHQLAKELPRKFCRETNPGKHSDRANIKWYT